MDEREHFTDTQSVPMIRFSCSKAFYFPERQAKEHFLYARAESDTSGILEYWIMDRGSAIEIIIALSVEQGSPAANMQTFLNLFKIAGGENEDAD